MKGRYVKMNIKDCIIGKRVIHVSHGIGTIAYKGEFEDEVLIDFDIEPEGWDKILCVSVGCLREA